MSTQLSPADLDALISHARDLDKVLRTLRAAKLETSTRYRELAGEREAMRGRIEEARAARRDEATARLLREREARDRHAQRDRELEELRLKREAAREWFGQQHGPVAADEALAAAERDGIDADALEAVALRVQSRRHPVPGGYLALAGSYMRRDFFDYD